MKNCSAFNEYNVLNDNDLKFLHTEREQMLGKMIKSLRNTIKADHLRTIIIRKKYKSLLAYTKVLEKTNHDIASDIISKNITDKIKIGEVGK